MKLAIKFTTALTLVFIVVLALRAYTDARSAVALQRSEISDEQRILATSVASALVEIWRSGGPEQARAWLRTVDEQRGHTRIRLTDEKPPHGLEQHREGTWKAGALVTRVAVPDVGVLSLRRSFDAEWTYVKGVITSELVTAVLVLLVYAVATLLLSRWLVARPVETLMQQAERARAGEPTELPVMAKADEAGELARKINRVARELRDARVEARSERTARFELEGQLRHANRLASVGRLAAGLVHDLGTPLNVISGRASMIANGEVEGGDVEDHARIVADEARRIATTIRGVLSFARAETDGSAGSTALLQVVREHVDLIQPIARKARVELRVVEESVDCTVVASGNAVRQVLDNLLSNALDATPAGGEVTVRTSTREGDGCVEVADNGCGIAAEHRARLFEPFFTTKPEGRGTGLGLSVCRSIVEDEGGQIAIESEVDSGTKVTVGWRQV